MVSGTVGWNGHSFVPVLFVIAGVLPMEGSRMWDEAADQVRLAGEAVDAGRPEKAAAILVRALRGGLWGEPRLWLALAGLPAEVYGFDRWEALWFDSPSRCHWMPAAITGVARAAALAGRHDDARALMSKAILGFARRSMRTPAARSRRWSGSVGRVEVPSVLVGDAVMAVTAEYFVLFGALCDGDRRRCRESVARLRAGGAGVWLERL